MNVLVMPINLVCDGSSVQHEESKDVGLVIGKDSLNEELRDRQKQASRFITLSAKLILRQGDRGD